MSVWNSKGVCCHVDDVINFTSMSNRGSSIVGEITSASASAWSLCRLASIFDDVNPIRTGAYDVSATCTMNAMNAPANPISISNNAEIARVRGVHRQQYTSRTKHVRTPPMFHVCEIARGVGAYHRRQYHPCQYYAPIPSHLDSALLTCAPEQSIYPLHAIAATQKRKERKRRNGLEAACVLVFKHLP